MKRLLGYLKPHKWVMTFATLLVLLIIVVELYRPIIIGDAIDDYINGYYQPYVTTSEDAPGSVSYKGLWLTRDADSVAAADASSSESSSGTDIIANAFSSSGEDASSASDTTTEAYRCLIRR